MDAGRERLGLTPADRRVVLVGFPVAVVGLVLAGVTLAEDVVVEVAQDEVTVREHGTSRTIARDLIAGVHHDGRRLVIETARGRRLVSARVEGGARRAAPAFRRFGYPWEND